MCSTNTAHVRMHTRRGSDRTRDLFIQLHFKLDYSKVERDADRKLEILWNASLFSIFLFSLSPSLALNFDFSMQTGTKTQAIAKEFQWNLFWLRHCYRMCQTNFFFSSNLVFAAVTTVAIVVLTSNLVFAANLRTETKLPPFHRKTKTDQKRDIPTEKLHREKNRFHRRNERNSFYHFSKMLNFRPA